MTAVSVVIVFLCTWWLALFMTLPFGVRRVEAPQRGHDPGAPARALLWRKAAATTLIAAAVTAAVWVVVESRALSLGDLDLLRPGR